MSYSITEACAGCGACAKKCPEKAISGEIRKRFDIDPDICTECGTCFSTCPQGAVCDPDGNQSPRKGKSRKSVKAHIDHQLCAGCRNCFLNCPSDAIHLVKRNFFTKDSCVVDINKCTGCGACAGCCITGAVHVD